MNFEMGQVPLLTFLKAPVLAVPSQREIIILLRSFNAFIIQSDVVEGRKLHAQLYQAHCIKPKGFPSAGSVTPRGTVCGFTADKPQAVRLL